MENEKFSGQITECRSCFKTNLRSVLSLGKSPLANNLLKSPDEECEMFPLELLYCENCHLCQLSYVVPPEKMFSHYFWVTSTTKTSRDHFIEKARHVVECLGLKGGTMVDIGSNDGFLVQQYEANGMKGVGIEPAGNICEIARSNNIDTIHGFFNTKTTDQVLERMGRVDLVTACNVFAHTHPIHMVTENVKKLLKEDGVFIVESQYVLGTLQTTTFDNMYHEHVSYYSLLALQNFFAVHDMEIFRFEEYPVHGGTFRVFVQRKGGSRAIEESITKGIQRERDLGMDSFRAYESFRDKVLDVKKELMSYLETIRDKEVVGYGAPAKATSMLNFFGIDADILDYIVEDNPLKHGYFVPGVKIPIRGKDALEQSPPDYVLILAWNYTEEILRNNAKSREQGVKFIVGLPRFREL